MEQHQLLDEDPVVGNSLSPLVADMDRFSGQQPPSPPWPGLDLDVDFDVHEPSSAGSGSHKKLSHNAYERDRRKELNDLYSTLRSLLPDADHTKKKKLSIPTTLCQTLEYIPRLRKQVEDLEKKKEGLQMTRARCSAGKVPMSERTTPVVSATPLDEKEIMVQVSLLSNMAKSLPLSKCVQVLEDEGLQLISSSTLSNFEINRAFYNLHFQRSQGAMKEYPDLLCDKLEKAIEEKAAPYQ